jgi:hypothetical protein
VQRCSQPCLHTYAQVYQNTLNDRVWSCEFRIICSARHACSDCILTFISRWPEQPLQPTLGVYHPGIPKYPKRPSLVLRFQNHMLCAARVFRLHTHIYQQMARAAATADPRCLFPYNTLYAPVSLFLSRFLRFFLSRAPYLSLLRDRAYSLLTQGAPCKFCARRTNFARKWPSTV